MSREGGIQNSSIVQRSSVSFLGPLEFLAVVGGLVR